MKKTFLLGVGAQKAGTTWFQQYVAQVSDSNFGPIKEYHTWDALRYSEFSSYNHRRRLRAINNVETFLRNALGRPVGTKVIRSKLQKDLGYYFNYFHNLLITSDCTITGDFTPSYAALPSCDLQRIRDGFECLGIDVKVVFLMRDPVERCLSAVRHNRRKKIRSEGVPLRGKFADAAKYYARTSQCALRSDYMSTVENILSVFSESDVFFGFYETLFTKKTLSQISTFLGCDVNDEYIDKKINHFGDSAIVDDESIAELRGIFNEQYIFCMQRFPETKEIWRHA